MIKVEPGKTTTLGTGKNVSGTADTFLESGPRDNLKTIDAYKSNKGLVTEANGESSGGFISGLTDEIKSSSFINSVKDGVSATTPSTEGDDTLSNLLWTTLLCGKEIEGPSLGSRKNKMLDTSLWLRSTGCSAENLLDLIKVENGEFTISQDELENRLNSTMNGSLAMLSGNQQTDLVTALGTAAGADPGLIKMTSQGVDTYLDGGLSGEVSNLSSLLSLVPGGESLVNVFDLAAEVVFLDVIIEKVIALGIPSLVKGLFDKITDDSVKTQVMRKRLRQSASVSDLETVNEIIDRIGMGQAQTDEPDLINVITGSYRLGSRTRATEYPAKQSQLISTLNKFDPLWDITTRDGTTVSNLEPFSVASKDAHILFKGSIYEKPASVGKIYRKRSYKNIVKKYHPYAVV